MDRRPILLAPSLLACDFAHLADEVERVERAGADWLHVDVMDGHFVPNLSMGPPVIESLRRVAHVPLDVHLMIEEPARYAEAFVRSGAHVLTFHWEVAPAAERAREVIAAFRAAGAPEVGVAVNPDTPIEPVFEILAEVDLVLVMSVHPGFGGQKFQERVLEKVRALRAHGYEGRLEMDGGLGAETIASCAAAGADVLVAGSAIFGAPDPGAALRDLRRRAERAREEASRVG